MSNTMGAQIKKILNLKLVTMLEFQNMKIFFAKEYTPNWLEEIFVISKIKNIISVLKTEPITGRFYEKELQKTCQEKFKIEKVIQKKVINCTSNGKDSIIHFNSSINTKGLV